jgi:hypothetical protein
MIANLKPGDLLTHNPDSDESVYDYNHLLDHRLKVAGFNLKLHIKPKSKGLSVRIADDNGGVVGETHAFWQVGKGKEQGEVHLVPFVTEMDEKWQNYGGGTSMYESMLTHAKHLLGTTHIKGREHSSSVSKVYRKLAKRHGMVYTAAANIGRGTQYSTKFDWLETPNMPFDGKYGAHKMLIKKEGDSAEWKAALKWVKNTSDLEQRNFARAWINNDGLHPDDPDKLKISAIAYASTDYSAVNAILNKGYSDIDNLIGQRFIDYEDRAAAGKRPTVWDNGTKILMGQIPSSFMSALSTNLSNLNPESITIAKLLASKVSNSMMLDYIARNDYVLGDGVYLSDFVVQNPHLTTIEDQDCAVTLADEAKSPNALLALSKRLVGDKLNTRAIVSVANNDNSTLEVIDSLIADHSTNILAMSELADNPRRLSQDQQVVLANTKNHNIEEALARNGSQLCERVSSILLDSSQAERIARKCKHDSVFSRIVTEPKFNYLIPIVSENVRLPPRMAEFIAKNPKASSAAIVNLISNEKLSKEIIHDIAAGTISYEDVEGSEYIYEAIASSQLLTEDTAKLLTTKRIDKANYELMKDANLSEDFRFSILQSNIGPDKSDTIQKIYFNKFFMGCRRATEAGKATTKAIDAVRLVGNIEPALRNSIYSKALEENFTTPEIEHEIVDNYDAADDIHDITNTLCRTSNSPEVLQKVWDKAYSQTQLRAYKITENPNAPAALIEEAYGAMKADSADTGEPMPNNYLFHITENPGTPDNVVEEIANLTDENYTGGFEDPISRAKDRLVFTSPDKVHKESVNVRFSTNKHRILRDLIDTMGGTAAPNKLPKELTQAIGNVGRLPNGSYSSKALQEHIDSLPSQKYNVSHSSYDQAQLHSEEPSNVFQLNMTNDIVGKLKSANVWPTFKKMYDLSKRSGHPVGKSGIGWVRWTGDGTGIHIDEIQTDLGQRMSRVAEEQARAQGDDEADVAAASERAKQEFHDEDMDKIKEILFGKKHPSELLFEAFHEWARNGPKNSPKGCPDCGKVNTDPDMLNEAGVQVGCPDCDFSWTPDEDPFTPSAPIGPGTPIHIWQPHTKAPISGLNTSKPLPKHMLVGYGEVPKKAGFKPSHYGALPTQSNPQYSGKRQGMFGDEITDGDQADTWAEEIRKSEWQNASCQIRSHVLGRRLVAKGHSVEVHDGFFRHGDSDEDVTGHTWLVVDGRIVDPTSDQFEVEPSSDRYETHSITDLAKSVWWMQDLRKVIDESHFNKVNGPLGSNPGGVFSNAAGQKHYFKFQQSTDHSQNELLANKLYQAAGVKTPDIDTLQMKNGKIGTAAPWMEGVEPLDSENPAHRIAHRKLFGLHAWLANWDAAMYGNSGMHQGKPIVMDAGGALQFRAQGAPKGAMFGPKVGEFSTLRDPSFYESHAIFGDMNPIEIRNAVGMVAKIPDETIDSLVAQHGPGDQTQKQKLAQTLKARKQDLIQKAGWIGKTEELAKMALIHSNFTKPRMVYRIEDWHGNGPYNPTFNESVKRPDFKYRNGFDNTPGPSEDFSRKDMDNSRFSEVYNPKQKRLQDTLGWGAPRSTAKALTGSPWFGFEDPNDAVAWFGAPQMSEFSKQGFHLREVPAVKVWRSESGRQVMFHPHRTYRPGKGNVVDHTKLTESVFPKPKTRAQSTIQYMKPAPQPTPVQPEQSVSQGAEDTMNTLKQQLGL